MSALQHEIKDAGFIVTLNRPAAGIFLTIPTARAQMPDSTGRNTGPDAFDAQMLRADRELGFHHIHNPGAYFLISSGPAQALRDYHMLTGKHSKCVLHFRDAAEQPLAPEDIQFHKLNAVLTMRPIALEAACDALTLHNFAQAMRDIGSLSLQDREELKHAFAAVQDSVDAVRDFKIDSSSATPSPERLLHGYIAMRRDKNDLDSYIQSAHQDQQYLAQRKNYAAAEEARKQPVPPAHFEVSRLERACHFRAAPDALLAVSHFNKASPGDRFYAVHVQYFLGKEPLSLADIQETAFYESAALLEPVTREAVHRLRKNKLVL